MLRRRLAAIAILGASIVLASIVVFHARGGGAPVQLSTVGSPDTTPPPFPADVANRKGPSEVNGQRCTQQPAHNNDRAVDIWNIETLPMLAKQTDEIVVADAVRQVAFWQHRLDASQHIEWSPATMTEYHIVNVVKGSSISGPWLTVTDGGATSAAIPTCKSQAYTIVTDPLPTVGTRYVLFLAADTNAGRIEADASQRFPILKGTVQTEAYVHPAAQATVVQHFTPMSLDAFLTMVGSLPIRG